MYAIRGFFKGCRYVPVNVYENVFILIFYKFVSYSNGIYTALSTHYLMTLSQKQCELKRYTKEGLEAEVRGEFIALEQGDQMDIVVKTHEAMVSTVEYPC